MGIYYKENPRTFDKAHLVLIGFTYVCCLKRMFDTIMISVDSHDEIIDMFNFLMKNQRKKDPMIVWYLPECGKPHFKAEAVHA